MTDSSPSNAEAPPTTVPPGEDEKKNLSEQRETFRQEVENNRAKGKKYVKKADRIEDEKLTELASSLSAMGGEMLTFLSRRMPNPLPPTETEIETFMSSSTVLIKKYLPLANEYQPELVFAGFLVFFIVPRMTKEKKETVESRIVADANAIIRDSASPSPSPL